MCYTNRWGSPDPMLPFGSAAPGPGCLQKRPKQLGFSFFDALIPMHACGSDSSPRCAWRQGFPKSRQQWQHLEACAATMASGREIDGWSPIQRRGGGSSQEARERFAICTVGRMASSDPARFEHPLATVSSDPKALVILQRRPHPIHIYAPMIIFMPTTVLFYIFYLRILW